MLHFQSSPLKTNEIFHKDTYNKIRMYNYIYRGVIGYNFPKNIVSLSLKIIFVLATSADPDEMPHYRHYAEFHLGLRGLTKYPFRGLNTLLQ